MKRINTTASALNTGMAKVDLGDNLTTEIPVDQRIASEDYADKAKTDAIEDATTKYGGLPGKVAGQGARLNNYETRVEAIETLGGLAPGDVSDATVKSLLANPATETATALSAAIDGSLVTAPVTVYHGTDSNHPRPAGIRPVFWIGSVTPFNRQAGDLVALADAEPAPWSPAELDLIAWHDASDGYTTGATVAQITDLGPSGNHLITPRGTTPVTVDGVALAHPSFKFDGTASLEAATYADGMWSGPVTVYMVARVEDLTAVASVLFDGTFGNSARIWVSSGGRLAVTAASLIQSDGGMVAVGETMVISATLDGANSSIAKNGTVLISGDIGATAPIRHRLGSNSGNGNFATAFIGETIVARAVTPEQDNDIVTRLKEKWSVA